MADLGAIAYCFATVHPKTVGVVNASAATNAATVIQKHVRNQPGFLTTGGAGNGISTQIHQGQQFISGSSVVDEPYTYPQINANELRNDNTGYLTFNIQNSGVNVTFVNISLMDDRDPFGFITQGKTDGNGNVTFYGLVTGEAHYYIVIENASYPKYCSILYSPSQTINIDIAGSVSSQKPLIKDASTGRIRQQSGLAILATKYSTVIGDGIASSYVVTHNLGTQSIVIQVFDTSYPAFVGDYVLVEPSIMITDTNNVTITFSTVPSANQYEVVIFG